MIYKKTVRERRRGVMEETLHFIAHKNPFYVQIISTVTTLLIIERVTSTFSDRNNKHLEEL